jgi:hypothetical protein
MNYMNMLEKIKTEKRLYFHFVVFLASLFYLLQQNIQFQSRNEMVYIGLLPFGFFYFLLHLLKFHYRPFYE